MPSASTDVAGFGLAGCRVLFLNWRCPWHPLAGGAESYCWNVAGRFAEAGADVLLATARAPGLPADEERGGVRIRRRGGTYTVYLWAALFLLLRGGRFSAVVDCQNGIPFFAPLFLLGSRVPVVLVVHHVHQDQFTLRFRWPVSAFGRLLESHVSRLVYGLRPIIAVSPGTRAEVRRRLNMRGPIFVVPNGVRPPDAERLPARSPTPSIVYLGRLVPHKRLYLLVQAAADLRRRWPDLRVDIVGDGPARPQLERLTHQLGLEDVVRFRGRVSDGERYQALASAWLLVTPSAGEGWGLTVIEANAVGRPALAFRVPGLVNSIREGVNGWLVGALDALPDAIDAALGRLSDPTTSAQVEVSCRRWAIQFSWQRTALRMADVVRTARLQVSAEDGQPTRAKTVDTATVVVLEATEGLEQLDAKLMRTDLWTVDGNTLRILLQGHDATTAISSLERLGLSGRARVRVARGSDLLLGVGGAD
jgi:glycosyltransferase involved in cell wall biosynthesis